jgi:hypothetical protein
VIWDQGPGFSKEFKVQGPGFKIQSSGFRAKSSEFRVQNSELRVQSSKFRVNDSSSLSGFRAESLGFTGCKAKGPLCKSQSLALQVQVERYRVQFIGYCILLELACA